MIGPEISRKLFSFVGVIDGLVDGFLDGLFVGFIEGFRVDGFGLHDGLIVGCDVGFGVGFGGLVNTTEAVIVFAAQSILSKLMRSVGSSVINEEIFCRIKVSRYDFICVMLQEETSVAAEQAVHKIPSIANVKDVTRSSPMGRNFFWI